MLGVIAFDSAIAGRRGPVQVYFYDLNTKKLFAADSNLYAPIEAPSDIEANKEAGEENERQRSGVRAMVFSCTDCRKKDTHLIAYLEKYPLEAKAALEKAMENPDDVDYEALYEHELERLIKAPEDEKWLPANSEEGMNLVEGVYRNLCQPDERPRLCFPPSQ